MKRYVMAEVSKIFAPGSGALALLLSYLVFGIAAGAFTGVLNNFLANVLEVDEFQRGLIEFFRELPGLLLVLILALLHRLSEWRIYRLGLIIAMLGVAAMSLTGSRVIITLLITVFSLGEHILMPVRQSITMHAAHNDKQGAAMGIVASAGNAGHMLGGLLAALVFYIGIEAFQVSAEALYHVTWGLVTFLLLVALLCSRPRHEVKGTVKRPRLYFHSKYKKYYILEVFYGARKQVFITFAPFVLILIYGMTTAQVAILVGASAAVNIFGGRFMGALTDRFGYRNIMIYDTVVLFFVCITYGYAHKIFSEPVAIFVVCTNFLLDAIISTGSMASGIYVREISDSQEEVAATLTTGISVNHVISVSMALLGGWVWKMFGVEMLFTFAAVMGLLNTTFAATIPRPRRFQPDTKLQS